jgi:hypothetical protein
MSGAAIDAASAYTVDGVPFSTPDEAWIWAVQGMQSRLSGANVKPGMATTTRPCEASDVLGIAATLARSGALEVAEQQVLLLYARYGITPMVLGPAHEKSIPHWLSGIDKLAPIMEQKGVIYKATGSLRDAG